MDGTLHWLDKGAAQRVQLWNPLVAELLDGLTQPHKQINPKFLYDQRGSELFDRITALPEYYPSRTEIGILRANAEDIADCSGRGAIIIEPGAGSCEKIRYLLADLKPSVYLPQDISAEFLRETSAELRAQFNWLDVRPLTGDFSDAMDLPHGLPTAQRIVFYPGSTIGNFDPPQALEFLRTMRDVIGVDGGMIIGVDMQKDPAVLNAAYNDAAGVTAQFNLNVLAHLNTLLSADFDPELFTHHAFYNQQQHRIEMHLVCRTAHTVNCAGVELQFAQGETIHTESSYKYTERGLAKLALQAGFTPRKSWFDERRYFGVFYLA